MLKSDPSPAVGGGSGGGLVRGNGLGSEGDSRGVGEADVPGNPSAGLVKVEGEVLELTVSPCQVNTRPLNLLMFSSCPDSRYALVSLGAGVVCSASTAAVYSLLKDISWVLCWFLGSSCTSR